MTKSLGHVLPERYDALPSVAQVYGHAQRDKLPDRGCQGENVCGRA